MQEWREKELTGDKSTPCRVSPAIVVEINKFEINSLFSSDGLIYFFCDMYVLNEKLSQDCWVVGVLLPLL